MARRFRPAQCSQPPSIAGTSWGRAFSAELPYSRIAFDEPILLHLRAWSSRKDCFQPSSEQAEAIVARRVVAMAVRMSGAGVLDDLFLWEMTDPVPPLQARLISQNLPAQRQQGLRTGTGDAFGFRARSSVPRAPWRLQIPGPGPLFSRYQARSCKIRCLRYDNVVQQTPPATAADKLDLAAGLREFSEVNIRCSVLHSAPELSERRGQSMSAGYAVPGPW